MKKLLLLLCLSLVTASLFAQTNAHMYLSNGMHQHWDMASIDSITYLKPTSEIIIPEACTLQAGKSARITYMASDGILDENIIWSSSDPRIARFRNDSIVAITSGKCQILATYKGVTSRCLVTVTPSTVLSFSDMIPQAAQASYATAKVGTYMAQALTTGNRSQTSSPAYRSGWGPSLWNDVQNPLSEHNTSIAPAYAQIMESEEGARNYQLVATTLYLYSLMQVVDMYGVAPLHAIHNPSNITYSGSEEVYQWLFLAFDQLIAQYSNPEWTDCPTNLAMTQQEDAIYGGDLKKWENLTKALRCRLWLRKLPNWDNNQATCNQIISMVNEVLGSDHWQEPHYDYPGGYLPEQNCPWGPYLSTLSTSIPTTFFLHGTLGSIDGSYIANRGYALDPRAAKIFEQRSSNRGPMLHRESNIGMDMSYTLTNYPDPYTSTSLTNPYTQDKGYIALITQEELMFIKAEAQFWAGDKAGAYATTVAATKFNMERYGLIEAEITSGAKGTNLKNQYGRFWEIKLPDATQFTLADLMQQKYIAMYLQSEQWNDMRRYNYSSSTNGIAYKDPVTNTPIYVYNVHHVHNGKVVQFNKDAGNYTMQYHLRRPYNLYEAYWCVPSNYANAVNEDAGLSPNAWVMQMPIPTNTTQDNHLPLTKRIIWAQKHNGPALTTHPTLNWE